MEINNSPKAPYSLKRFLLGIFLLIIVDIIWVASAELSIYIFHNENFNKPFFTTYFKTAMFSIYLIGFIFIKRWQVQLFSVCANPKVTKKLLKEVKRFSQGDSSAHGINTSENISRSSTPITEGNITPPTFENMTEDDSSENSEEAPHRKVCFNNVREVRSLAHKHGDAQILARMSQSSINELHSILEVLHGKLSLFETLKLSLMFVFLWILGTLMYQEALAKESAAVTNILSSTSGLFTLILASIFPSSVNDGFTLSKLVSVLVNLGGIFIICWFDPNRPPSTINFGEIYSLLGALFYACYIVLIKRKVGDGEKLDMPLFFGFVGLFGAILFVPVFVILHYANLEHFELPAHKTTWSFLIINALIGTVLSELLWLWGCFLTSSLMATLALGMIIPMAITYDFIVNGIKFSWAFLLGSLPIFLSFIAVTILTHYSDWDPIKDLICFCCCCFYRKEETVPLLDNKKVCDDGRLLKE